MVVLQLQPLLKSGGDDRPRVLSVILGSVETDDADEVPARGEQCPAVVEQAGQICSTLGLGVVVVRPSQHDQVGRRPVAAVSGVGEDAGYAAVGFDVSAAACSGRSFDGKVGRQIDDGTAGSAVPRDEHDPQPRRQPVDKWDPERG